MKKILMTAGLLSAFGLPAAQLIAGTDHRAGHKQAAIVCPVTGDKIASVKNAVGHSTFKGKTYYFCCAGCKPRFDKSPAKFVKNAAKGKFEKM